MPLNEAGVPDFKYVATHICDSVKKRLKREGMKGIQGEFGIGLLSFWTVGERLSMSSAGRDELVYQMEMVKDRPGYVIHSRRALLTHPGTELVVRPLLPGIRALSGEKIQNYLASELRDRIRTSGVKIAIKDRFSRREYAVEPRQFEGRLIHSLPAVVTVAAELVKKDEKTGGAKKGLPSYTFQRAPGELWRSRYDQANNLIVVNNGHADYRYAAQKPSRKLKYICKLYAKELVLSNFQGFNREELLERMVELSLYTEENLK